MQSDPRYFSLAVNKTDINYTLRQKNCNHSVKKYLAEQWQLTRPIIDNAQDALWDNLGIFNDNTWRRATLRVARNG